MTDTPDSEKPLSIKQAVMELAPTLLKKRSQGFGTADLVELLSQHQITIKPSDLSRYLREYKRASSEVPGKKMTSGKSKQTDVSKMTDSHEPVHGSGAESLNT